MYETLLVTEEAEPFQNITEEEQERQILRDERRHLEQERKELEQDKKEFQRRQELEESHLKQEKQLFEMKWRILEEEVRKLADEKQKMQQHKAFYEQVAMFEQNTVHYAEQVFFKGISDEISLKKRYKDLIKIFHPDNVSGDTNTIQEINREYKELRDRISI